MANVLQILPELQGDEQIYVQGLLQNMTDERAHIFANAYRTRRRDPMNIMLFSIVGFLGIAGIQRFMVDQVGMGILYLLTCGLCGIGTIVDLITHKSIAFTYNQRIANEVAQMVSMMN